jgi:hypothetical protein
VGILLTRVVLVVTRFVLPVFWPLYLSLTGGRYGPHGPITKTIMLTRYRYLTLYLFLLKTIIHYHRRIIYVIM